VRRLFTTAEAAALGITQAELRWGERTGRWRRVWRGVYGEGPENPTPLDEACAVVVATGGTASGHVAGVLLGLDSVRLRGPDVSLLPNRSHHRPGVRRRHLQPHRIVTVDGIRCTDGFQTLVDLAPTLSDLVWEQALESAFRKHLTCPEQFVEAMPGLSRARTPGRGRISRVLDLRPPGAPPTESLLETLMVQLARTVPGLPDPVRQLAIEEAHARVDLAWPHRGLFIELDGQHHLGQPVYDASRETAVVAAMGWLCGRFTWTEVVHTPASTARRLAALAGRARARPVVLG
jgi:hypothetical protein